MDPFDSQLNQTASVLVRDVSGGDAYGQPDPTFVTIGTGVKCRIVLLGVQSDREFLAKSKEAIAYKKVFLRPWFDSNGNPLNVTHWFLINGVLYDIFQIHDPGGLGHHLECECRLVLTSVPGAPISGTVVDQEVDLDGGSFQGPTDL